MNLLVAYESKYGFTKTYAQWLAGDLGATLLHAKEVTPGMLQACDGFVYGGGLYAGGVSGIALLTKNFEALRHKPLCADAHRAAETPHLLFDLLPELVFVDNASDTDTCIVHHVNPFTAIGGSY